MEKEFPPMDCLRFLICMAGFIRILKEAVLAFIWQKKSLMPQAEILLLKANPEKEQNLSSI